MEVKDINIKSQEVQEILGTPPSSIVRWGITAIFISIMMVLGMSYLIKYPDLVKGEVIITTENPPIKVASFSSGYLQKLFVSDNDSVSKNQEIALIESTADYADVLAIENLIFRLDTISSISDVELSFKRKSLGEIQTEFNNFTSSFNAVKFFYKNNFEAESNRSIGSQLNQVKSQYSKILNQKHLLKLELDLLDKQLVERETLYQNKVISKEEFENFKVGYLQKKQQFETYKINLSSNKISQESLKKDIADNSSSRVFKDNEVVMKFDESKDLLISKINWWKKKYLIEAPISGLISFGDIWSENQRVVQSEDLFTIVPQKNNLIAKIFVPLEGIGKVKLGQNILVDLSSFPAAEFGYVECSVSKISMISNVDNFYVIEATLPATITTSFRKKIDFIPQMKGSASIVTEKKRIISRIFEQFNKLINFNK
jgi:multidrug resistance efflux pump